MKLINPYSIELERPADLEIHAAKPSLVHRDCRVWKQSVRHYVYERDGVIFAERVGCGIPVIDDFLDGDGYQALRMRDAHALGMKHLGVERMTV